MTPSTQLIDIQQLRRGFAESPILSAVLQNSSLYSPIAITSADRLVWHLALFFTITSFDIDLRLLLVTGRSLEKTRYVTSFSEEKT